jgi:hypothetical protein
LEPGRRLSEPRGSVDVDTGLEIKERTRVTATLSFGLWKTVKPVTLYSRTAKVTVKTQMTTGDRKKGEALRLSSEEMRVRTEGSTVQGSDGVSPPQPVPLFDDTGGIRITSPSAEDLIRGTGPISVTYSVTAMSLQEI